MKDTPKIKGRIKTSVYDIADNVVIEGDWIDNTITNASLASLSSLTGATGSGRAFKWLAVGTDNTAEAASHTLLQSELSSDGFTRASATVTQVTTTQTNDTLQLVHTWTASGNQTVEETGVFDTSTSDTSTMLGRALTGSKAVNSGQKLKITYQIIFS